MIIALSGLPGAGKDVIGVELKNVVNSRRNPQSLKPFNRSFSIKKFAGKANILYAEMNGVNYSQATRETHEMHRAKFREFAESMKVIFGQDIWAKSLIKRYNDETSNNWIITDLRFMEELKLLRDIDEVFLIRIRRMCTECLLVETHEKTCSQNNITDVETRLASYYGWDLIIDNNGTPEEAVKQILSFLLNHYTNKL